MPYIVTLTPTGAPSSRGGAPYLTPMPGAGLGAKALGLQRLAQRGYRTPATFVCVAAAAIDHACQPHQVDATLRNELSLCLRPAAAYAVRSSADVEDGAVHSYAGQFATHLDVRGVDGVMAAVQQVRASAHDAGVRAYQEAAGTAPQRDAPQRVAMAVIIQEMVAPGCAGVAFSCNPMTGLD